MDNNSNLALHHALETEYAAIYVYQIIGPLLTDDNATVATTNLEIHYLLSDTLVSFLTRAGQELSIPAVSYHLPFPVDDNSHSVKLAIIIETECTKAYRILVQESGEEEYKKFALNQLTQATIRLAHWNKIANNYPIIAPLPGQ